MTRPRKTVGSQGPFALEEGHDEWLRGPDSFCITNDEDFPGGTCSIECTSHDDCPDPSACISTNGGVCATTCRSADDCRDGYGCESKSDKSGSGESMVCID